MSTPVPGPLTEADLDQLKERLADADRADREIAKALQAGIDVGDARERLRDLREKLNRVKQTYFPGR